jgi:hypothetical protein
MSISELVNELGLERSVYGVPKRSPALLRLLYIGSRWRSRSLRCQARTDLMRQIGPECVETVDGSRHLEWSDAEKLT